MKIYSLKPYNLNKIYQNNSFVFKAKDDVIDDGDYVKISKKKYKRDQYWRTVDWTIVALAVTYLLYKAFKYKPPKI